MLPGTSSTGNKKVTIPANAAPNTYHLLACADDSNKVPETNEANNCIASAGTVVVALPDLVTTLLSNPPGSAARGGKFTLTDTVLNQGTGPAAASTMRYYLSLNQTWDAGDTLLSGTRPVSALGPGASQSGSKQITVPLSRALGTYYALACADDKKKVKETSEANNCLASGTTVTITP